MSRLDSPISLGGSTQDSPPPSSAAGRDVISDAEQDGTTGIASTRPLESARKRASVLAGSALLQLPVWGFAMSYGVLQEYLSEDWTLHGDRSGTGVIGTTFNGVMYLSMPLLFALFTRRWASARRAAALCGVALTCLSFLLSSLATEVWHLIATQGVAAALGCALVYSPMTLSLGEWFNTSNRALAYALVLSSKNVVGSVYPFMLRGLLDRYGFKNTTWALTGIVAGTSVLAIAMIPNHPSTRDAATRRARGSPWHFLKHRTIYVYGVAIMLQSCGYGIPQTYLNTYAHEVTRVSHTSATLLLTLFNAPGILASPLLGLATSDRHLALSAATVTSASALTSALAALLFWGLTSEGAYALLVCFSVTFGFSAGGYSATWGRILDELEGEAAARNEAVDAGLLYGVLNGARGVGYVAGGLAGVSLLRAGASASLGGFAYGTSYGPLILFTGLSSVFGGWGLLWKCRWARLLRLA